MDDAFWKALGSIVTVLGSSGVLLALIRWVWKWATGRSQRERIENASSESQRVAAVEERQQSDARARVVEDYASRLRRQLDEHNVTPIDWPDLEHTIPRAQLRRLRNSRSKEKS
ncbi:MAG: hypothetical protein ABIP33_06530 [Pseudolysinimonas sp.]